MKYAEIIKLLDAGYTREEILEMQSENVNPDIEPEAAPEEKSKEPEYSFNDMMVEMKEAFDGFKKEMQAFNIMNSHIDVEEKTGEDVMANIINPYTEDK